MKLKYHPLYTFAACLALSSQVVFATIFDGGNTQVLNSVSSGTATNPNVYQNYLIRSQLNLSNVAWVTVQTCDVGGFSGTGFFLNNVDNVSITHNNIHDLGGGIGSYPTHIANSNFDGNTFNKVSEGIHLDFGFDGTSKNNSVSYNSIPNNTRYAIELQSDVTNLKVTHNYCGAVSVATQSTPVLNGQYVTEKTIGTTGGFPTALTTGNEIANNTILGSLQTNGSTGGGLEVYGSGTNVHDNYFAGWGNAVYWDATGFVPNSPWYITNNISVGCNVLYDPNPEGFGPSSGPYVDIAPTVNGNQIFAANDPKAPTAPTATATVSGTVTTTQLVTIQATSQINGIQVSGLPATGGTLTSFATGNSGAPMATQPSGWPHTFMIPVGQTTYLDQTVPNAPGGWQVYYTFPGAAPAVARANPVQVFTSPPATKPTTGPTLTHTLQVFSDGTLSVDGGTAK